MSNLDLLRSNAIYNNGCHTMSCGLHTRALWRRILPARTMSTQVSSSQSARTYTPLRRPQLTSTNAYADAVQSIGNTALIRLRTASERSGCEIYGKAEYQNPGGSVKDRAALWMIMDAEERGILTPGSGTIVEGTAGNTGIGLTLVGNARGYRTIIVIAETQSPEKKNTLRQCGAVLLEVPAVPFKNPLNYVHVASRLAADMSSDNGGRGILYANQWDNPANRRAHYESTGPEIFAQTGGRIDAFSSATGTGGTLSGVHHFFNDVPKDNWPRGKRPLCFLTDPRGAALYRYFSTGELKSEGDSISEGIGQSRLTGLMKDYRPDGQFEIHDTEALNIAYDTLQYEGLSLGSSSAINVAGAMAVAKHLGPGHTIVTILCDKADRYANKLFNLDFLKGRSLPYPKWIESNKVIPDDLQRRLKKAMTPPT